MTRADLNNFTNDPAALPRTTTLLREVGLRTLVLHLKAAERIPEHQTAGAILVQCVEGQGVFAAGEDIAELRPGVLISVPAAALHSVAAAEDRDLLLLVTISEGAVAGQGTA